MPNVNILNRVDVDINNLLFGHILDIMNIFELMPNNHFGELSNKIRNDLNNGESILVYGVYGSGIQYFMRYLESELTTNNQVLFFRGALIQDNAIKIIKNSISKLGKNKDLDKAIKKFNKYNKLFILIDSFQSIKNPAELLELLGVLRKSNPHSIINFIGSDQSFITTLKEIFKMHDAAISSVYRLSPFDLEGTKRIIEINNKFFNWQIPLNKANEIYKLSGGNPRLIKYLSKVLMEEGLNSINDIQFLTNHYLIESKLHKFIELLFQLDKSQLKTLSILNEQDELFSQLLRYKVEKYELSNLSQLIPELSNKERKVFSYLFINKGKVVSTDKLDFILNLTGDSYSLWASYKAINRLRKKIKDKFTLRSIKGQGYILEELSNKV